MIVRGRVIDSQSAPYIIAEIGNNHQGDIETCMHMIHAAKQAGADAVKLQRRGDMNGLFMRAMQAQPYGGDAAYGDTYGAHRRALELSDDDWRRARDFAAYQDITLFGTAFDERAVEFLAGLNMPALKLAAASWRDAALYASAAATGLPVFASFPASATGAEIREAIGRLPRNNHAVMCTTSIYPPADDELWLDRIGAYAACVGAATAVGLSSHHQSIIPPLLAVCLGATVIEVHFTLNRAWRGTDHAYSIETAGLARLCEDARRVRSMLRPSDVAAIARREAPALQKMGRCIWPTGRMERGRVLRAEDAQAKSPGMPGGLAPGTEIVGKCLTSDASTTAPFRPEDFLRGNPDDKGGAE